MVPEHQPIPGAKPVIILGMHRSGTSCLTGCLEENGLYLGDVSQADPHNRKGNRENKILRTINEDVLELSGAAWDRPPKQLKWNNALRARRDEYISGFDGQRMWGFKDPRVVLTLPFWLEGLSDVEFVGTFRHPAIVSASLARRRGLTAEIPQIELWKTYNRIMLNLLKQHQFSAVCFDWPSHMYIQAVSEISIGLGLKVTTGKPLQFFDERLRTAATIEESHAPEDIEALSIYNDLLARSYRPRGDN